MSNLPNIISNFLNIYTKKENEFMTDLKRFRPNFKIFPATKDQNIYQHFDVIAQDKNRQLKFEIKAAKKINRNDISPNYSIITLEIQGVTGRKGWLYGDTDFFVFELKKHWLVINKETLIKRMERLCDLSTLTQNRTELYKPYQRFGRQDKIVKIKTRDLDSLGFLIQKGEISQS